MKWSWNKNAVVQYLRRLVSLSEEMDIEAASVTIRQNVYFRGPNVFILFCAIIIASVGLNVNSIPVIIGAMLVSPLMGPIMGFGMGLGTNDTDLVRTSLKNLGVMVSISILASTLYFLISPLSMENPPSCSRARNLLSMMCSLLSLVDLRVSWRLHAKSAAR